MTEDRDEGKAALKAAKAAVERAQFLDMLPVSIAEHAVKAYLKALPGHWLVSRPPGLDDATWQSMRQMFLANAPGLEPDSEQD